MIWRFVALEYIEECLKFSRVNGLMLNREIQFVLFEDSYCLFERVTCTPVKPQNVDSLHEQQASSVVVCEF
jgi:hypothetical protein